MSRVLTRSMMLAMLILASSITTMAADPTKTNQCVQIIVSIEKFPDPLRVETPIEIHRGTGHGGASFMPHGGAKHYWSMGTSVSRIEGNRIFFNISLRFNSVDSSGKTITEGELREELNVLPRKVTFSAFDTGVTITSYTGKCMRAPVTSK